MLLCSNLHPGNTPCWEAGGSTALVGWRADRANREFASQHYPRTSGSVTINLLLEMRPELFSPYFAVNPPSTIRLCPVTKDDLPEHNQRTASATSSTRPRRPIGWNWTRSSFFILKPC